MAISGLKTQITVTFVTIIFTALFLGNLVVVMFWQKGLLHSEIGHVRSVISVVDFSEPAMQDDIEREEKLDIICTSIGRHCGGIVYFDGEKYSGYGIDTIEPVLKSVGKTAAISKSEVLRLEGSVWGIFSFSRRYLFAGYPLSEGDSKWSQSITIVIELESLYSFIREDQKTVFLYLMLNLVFLSVIGVIRLTRISVKPVERMIRISEDYQLTDGMISVGENTHSEFGRLTMALNSMLMRIELDRKALEETVESLEKANRELKNTHEEMLRTEKLASVGRLSAGLAHEIGNPIGIVQGYLELLSQPDISSEDKRQFSERALAELERVNRLIRQLLNFAKRNSSEKTSIDLKEIFNDLNQLASLKKSDDIKFEVEIEEDISIRGEEDGLRQVFMNCILNAVDALKLSGNGNKQGIIRVTAREADNPEQSISQRYILVKIEDDGVGIERDLLETVFDPFVTTKEPGKGTGLGLFVSHQIVEANGGKMWIESENGIGTTIHILLPVNPIENRI